jgi:hypothetical protein
MKKNKTSYDLQKEKGSTIACMRVQVGCLSVSQQLAA